MKILLIGPVPPPHGGISVHVTELARQLREAGTRCEVLDVRQLWRSLALLRYAARHWTIHLHTSGHGWKSWATAVLCGLTGGRSVLTLHSGLLPGYLASSATKRVLAATVCALYDRVICVNAPIRDAIHSSRTEVLPACLPVRRGDSIRDVEIQTWMDSHRPLVSTALFFRPEYGFDVLLAAIDTLRSHHPAIGCIVMGSGEQRALAERRLRHLGLEPHVLLAGDLDHATCLAVMSGCDVFVRATHYDGDSISVREALSLGIPVVATRVGMRPRGVILCNPGDPQDLAEKLDLALGKPHAAPAPPDECFDRLMEIYDQASRKTGRYDAARVGA